MRITWKKQNNTLKIRLIGELDHHCAVELRTKLDAMLTDESIKRLEFDMTDVTFMDSSGIGVILGRYRILVARNGSIGILKAPRNVDRILRMSGVYTLCDTTEGGKAI